MMFRIFASALAAGLFSAVLITLLENVTTTPLILQAEILESQMSAAIPATDHADDGHAHSHDDGAWAPEDGIERQVFTLIANSVTAIAYALLIIVGLTIGSHKINLTKGFMLGIGGFAVFTCHARRRPCRSSVMVVGMHKRVYYWLRLHCKF